jgi:hypothetical protein
VLLCLHHTVVKILLLRQETSSFLIFFSAVTNEFI